MPLERQSPLARGSSPELTLTNPDRSLRQALLAKQTPKPWPRLPTGSFACPGSSQKVSGNVYGETSRQFPGHEMDVALHFHSISHISSASTRAFPTDGCRELQSQALPAIFASDPPRPLAISMA